MQRARILISALALLSAPAIAAEWSQIGRTTTGSVWEADFENASQLGGIARIWVRVDHSADRTEVARRSEGLLIVYCQIRRYTVQDAASYDALGRRVVGAWRMRNAGGNIRPDSIHQTVWERACPPETRGEPIR